MKKKIGIITIISPNLGNRLQNYALQEYLVSQNFNVKTIPMYSQNLIKRELKFIIRLILSYIIPKYKSVSWDIFDKKINWEKYSVNDNSKLLVKKYDYFIAGSDQIWNPLFYFNSEREFLTFAYPEQRIAYAASIGISELPSECKTQYAKMLNGFSELSVREDDAAKIIEKLTNRSAKVVIDPTMLLTKEKWREVSKNSKVKIKYKYVVKYFLGSNNPKYDEYIEKKAKEVGAKVLDILEYNKYNNNVIGPTEFVYIISNSLGVFTDSFHGTVFSLLFEKNFVVFDRPFEKKAGDMSSRLDTLLNKFSVQNQRISNNSQLYEVQPKVDYENVKQILNKERKIAEQYLLNAIK
ncbi:MAG: polysaccharide pyruvyl transferase family protein [Clostridium sp.]|nr:polysaccharide pyruvyl transferase family protein [Clostridium sp.]